MLENSGLTLEAKEDIVDERHIDRFKHLSHEDEKLVEKNPAFGKIICRCETITEGEIINAVHRQFQQHPLMRSREDVMQTWEDARVVSVDQEFRRSS